MNENIYSFLDQMKDTYGESPLQAFIELPDYILGSELEGAFEDWKESTNTLLRKAKRIAKVNGQEDTVDVIDNLLDNLK